jgi:hypothetical protein
MSINRISSKEEFHEWLSKMDEEINSLIINNPVEIQRRLDFSPNSLDIIENLIIDNYSDLNSLLDSNQSQILDRLSRYVGETFRKTVGGQWIIEIEDPDPHYAYNGVPKLSEPASICPITTVTTSAHRRKGHYIRNVLENILTDLTDRRVS